ncbi:hypothetical protein O7599_26165 [Streptomyces sp. WMMC500]|uniref:hypothetical protein n=1 Tax=Streptomyces sp. WMMC500 TaxID=3015154 RepID=UPI00248B92E1|nr:hypothetical protein [Streptomyces sp. WMMC500]WBB59068.1 hypothetical protein O7599_26165 [Streptomyces sp. WMMC500]
MRRAPSRHLIAWTVLAAAAAPLLTGCGDDGENTTDNAARNTPRSSPPATPKPAESPSPPKPIAVDGAKLGAMDTVLVYCGPGLPGSPREGCDLGRIGTGITDITRPIHKKIAASQDEEQYADVSSAAKGLEKAVKTLENCGDWYSGRGSGGERDVACGVAWNTLTHEWGALKTALPWPSA